MHDTAESIGKRFLEIYATPGSVIVDFGSYNFNGTLKEFCPSGSDYIGLDFSQGPSVDVIVEVGKPAPLASESADIVLSSSQIEHDPMFWDTFLEFVRIVSPGGYIYINTPSNGPYRRFPNDYWRLYPDAGLGLEAYAAKKGFHLSLIESFIAERNSDNWNDFVAVFRKMPFEPDKKPYLHLEYNSTNVRKYGSEEIITESPLPQDMRIINDLKVKIYGLEEKISRCESNNEAIRSEFELTDQRAPSAE